MTLQYKSELVGEVRRIRQEFVDLYQPDPSRASEYFRERIHSIQWEKIRASPKNFKGLLVDLRVAANTSRNMTYSPEQMEAISQALELCEKYEGLTFEESCESTELMEERGLDIMLKFDEEGIQTFLDVLKERRETGECPFYKPDNSRG